jgi:hypothetical protein
MIPLYFTMIVSSLHHWGSAANFRFLPHFAHVAANGFFSLTFFPREPDSAPYKGYEAKDGIFTAHRKVQTFHDCTD